ncbi:MAG: hypothetical protein AB7J28_10120 [Hyphomonadaceae bacterium]
MSQPFIETYGFSFLVISDLEYEAERGPQNDEDAERVAQEFARRLTKAIARRTGATPLVTIAYAYHGSEHSAHFVNLSLPTYDSWVHWHRLFFNFRDSQERWIVREWEFQEGENGLADVSVAIDFGSEYDRVDPAASSRRKQAREVDAERRRGKSEYREHRRELTRMLWIAFGAGLFLMLLASSAWWTFASVQSEVEHLREQLSARTSADQQTQPLVNVDARSQRDDAQPTPPQRPDEPRRRRSEENLYRLEELPLK